MKTQTDKTLRYRSGRDWSDLSGLLARLMLVVMGMTLCCSLAVAQSGAGAIQGTVKDATGAVIPGATIHVVNEATGVSTDATSNSAGFYQAPSLFAGSYTITVKRDGMQTYRTSIQLLVSQSAVINPVLTVGAVTQQTTVVANIVQLTTTDSGTVSSVLDNARINQLPENGRNLLSLTGQTTPGLVGGGQRFGGLNSEALEYVVDGTPTGSVLNGGENNGGGQQQVIDPDSVQEVSLKLSNAGAEFATPGTGIVTTKSGTNRLHGTGFETARNNAFGIAKARQDPSNFAAPQYIRNEFGVSAGGPVVLPHLYDGRNKTFLFGAFERYSLARKAATLGTVPSVAMRNGDFSGIVSNGTPITLYDPATTYSTATCPYNAVPNTPNAYCRTPFPNNQIPLSRISPVAKLVYQLLPQPTNNLNPTTGNNFNPLDPNLTVTQQFTGRLDHTFNDSNRAYLRYTQVITADAQSGSPALSLAVGDIPAGAGLGYINIPTYSHIAALGYTHVFSPTFFSETVLSQQWFNVSRQNGTDQITNYETKLGLPNNFGRTGFPALGAGTIEPLTGSMGPYSSVQIVSTLDENLTKILGRHQMKFGFRYRHQRIEAQPQAVSDNFAVNGLPTALYNTATGANYNALNFTGLGEASFFLGSGSNYTVQLPNPHSHYHVMEFDGYFQDDFHVSNKLTFNLGLRYEAHPAMWYKYGLYNSFDLKNDAMVLTVPTSTLVSEGYTTQAIIDNDKYDGVKFESAEQAGFPNKLLRDYNLNFLPRFGFAYQPFGTRVGTVIRGAFGQYIFPLDYASGSNQVVKNNPLTNSYTQDYTVASQAVDSLPNELIRYNDPVKFGVMGLNTSNVIDSGTTTSILPGINLQTIDPNWAPDTVNESNITLEQPLKGNSVIRVTWTRTTAKNLDIIDHYNNHPTNFQYELATGTTVPTGGASVIGTPLQNTYANTATGPYDQTTWGGGTSQKEATGWSNDNSLTLNYQRLFHHGFGYQVSYVFSKAMKAGGDQSGNIYPDAKYPGVSGSVGILSSPYGTIGPVAPPPVRPSGLAPWAAWHEMNRYQLYKLDPNTPVHNVQFNGIVDLPFGTGKHFLGHANRFWNEVVGGFQIAGSGQVISQSFQANSSWGPIQPYKSYKKSKPIMDCHAAGICYKAYMYFNGYLAPKAFTGAPGGICTVNCYSGLPSDYMPIQTPIDNDPATANYGTNNVVVTLANAKQTTVGFDGGPQGANPLSKQYFSGPMNWNADLSLFKVFPITESVNLRVNVDAFNAFNIQGTRNPAGSGVLEYQPGSTSSYWTPRQLQLTARLSF